ncbi:MAG TPA: hypothetical protein VMH83_05355 [Candidatus Acidoferrum sp.]|nr:hypothetical protein [Candidatus Acidoferrum sp.]
MTTAPASMPELQTVIDFLASIGIPVHEKQLDTATFLPGLQLGAGCIYLDYDKLAYPGDLLHEAGHLAVTTPEIRRTLGTAAAPPNWPDGGEELGAILWSYAAAVHLELPPQFVFHADGYKGDAQWLIDEFGRGNYIGLPFLEWIGLCRGPATAAIHRHAAYPFMTHWLRT